MQHVSGSNYNCFTTTFFRELIFETANIMACNRIPAGAVSDTKAYIMYMYISHTKTCITCSAVVENVDRKLALRAFCGVLGSATKTCNT